MKHIIPIKIIDTYFLCEIVKERVIVRPLNKRDPLNNFLSPGAIKLIEKEVSKSTGENCEIA